jgi:hypothetical protein
VATAVTWVTRHQRRRGAGARGGAAGRRLRWSASLEAPYDAKAYARRINEWTARQAAAPHGGGAGGGGVTASAALRCHFVVNMQGSSFSWQAGKVRRGMMHSCSNDALHLGTRTRTRRVRIDEAAVQKETKKRAYIPKLGRRCQRPRACVKRSGAMEG